MELGENGNYRKRLAVPSGFRNLLEGLTVEILRSNPPDIYAFAADYFKERLDARQELGYDDCLLGSQIDGYYKYEPQFAGKREELDKAATKIQSTFRGHKVRQETKIKQNDDEVDESNSARYPENSPAEGAIFGGKNYGGKEHAAATSIQAGYRGNSAEDPENSPAEGACSASFGGKEYGGKEHAAVTSIQAGYRGYSTRKDLGARNEAATTIQAGYRGYVVRKGQDGGTVTTFSSEAKQTDDKDAARIEEEDAAAIKIQAAYRGHHVREAIRRGNTRDILAEGGMEKEGEVASTLGEGSGDADGVALVQSNNHDIQTGNDTAAVKIQASYRGYRTRKEIEGKKEAATTIQSYYRGHRVRTVRRAKSEAAVTIQSRYRGYRTRKELKKRHSTKSFLEVSNKYDEFAIHRDSRTSFSLPEGVQFEGSLDEDSDTEIDKMVDRMEASGGLKVIEEASSPDITEEQNSRK